LLIRVAVGDQSKRRHADFSVPHSNAVKPLIELQKNSLQTSIHTGEIEALDPLKAPDPAR
jgi:hypothetical protein